MWREDDPKKNGADILIHHEIKDGNFNLYLRENILPNINDALRFEVSPNKSMELIKYTHSIDSEFRTTHIEKSHKDQVWGVVHHLFTSYPTENLIIHDGNKLRFFCLIVLAKKRTKTKISNEEIVSFYRTLLILNAAESGLSIEENTQLIALFDQQKFTYDKKSKEMEATSPINDKSKKAFFNENMRKMLNTLQGQRLTEKWAAIEQAYPHCPKLTVKENSSDDLHYHIKQLNGELVLLPTVSSEAAKPSVAPLDPDTPSAATLDPDTPSAATLDSVPPSAATLDSASNSAATLDSEMPPAAPLDPDTPSAATLDPDTPSAATLDSAPPSAATLNSEMPPAAPLDPDTPSAATLDSDMPPAAPLGPDTPSALSSLGIFDRNSPTEPAESNLRPPLQEVQPHQGSSPASHPLNMPS